MLEDRRLLSTFTVMNTNSSGSGSLAQAIADANGDDQANTIEFSPTAFTTPRTITLGGSELELSDTVGLQTITGPAAGVTINGANQSRVFQVGNGVTATLSGLTLTGGNVGLGKSGGGLYNEGTTTVTDCTISGNSSSGGGGLGNGGVYNDGKGNMTVTDCTISGNSALSAGGGLDNIGSANMILTDCTISGNWTGVGGGGLANTDTANLTLTGCTISGNLASSRGGGLYNTVTGNLTLTGCTVSGNSAYGYGALDNDAKVTLTDTIIAGNSSRTGTDGIGGGGTVSGSYNLLGTGGSGGLTSGVDHNIVLTSLSSLGLAPLGSYGGPTQTMALLPGSAAIGMGTAVSGVTTDQRGLPLDSPDPDIGAFQSQGFTLTVLGGTPQSALINTAFAVPLRVKLTANDPLEPVDGGVILFAAPPGGASAALSGDTITVGSDGVALVTATANSSLGSYTIVASSPATGAIADFQLTNLLTMAVTVSAGDGPTITSVRRYGYHMRPTTVDLAFDQALDATTAQDVDDYRIIGPAGRVIAIKSAVYDPATLTVILHPSQRISVHHVYNLIVDGTAPHGLTNTLGELLDGADNGRPDSDYRTSLSWRNLVLDPVPSGISRWPKRTTGDVKLKSSAAHAVSHEAGLSARSFDFRR
jgi:parallel beta-helix repeat protein